MTTKSKIIYELRQSKNDISGADLLAIAKECERLFHLKLEGKLKGQLFVRDLSNCAEVFTGYYKALNCPQS